MNDVRISRFTSWFLDLLRLLAAVGVFVAHLRPTHLLGNAVDLDAVAHVMVICFFILSGFLIAASVERGEMCGVRYAALRLGRLWSVLLPALALTLVLELTARVLSPDQFLIPPLNRGNFLLRYPVSALFLNELWFYSAGMPFNGPVWSLAYEAWYYALFGIAMYAPRRWKWPLLLMAAVLIGPKILMLLPVWLAGVGLWHLFPKRDRLRRFAWPILVASVLVVACWIRWEIFFPAQPPVPPFYYSAAWISDLACGLAIAGLILGVDLLWGHRQPWSAAEIVVKRAAGVSFTLYLVHFPLMMFVSMRLKYDRDSAWQVAGIMVTILAFSFFVGSRIEPQRKYWSAKIEDLLHKACVGSKKSDLCP